MKWKKSNQCYAICHRKNVLPGTCNKDVFCLRAAGVQTTSDGSLTCHRCYPYVKYIETPSTSRLSHLGIELVQHQLCTFQTASVHNNNSKSSSFTCLISLTFSTLSGAFSALAPLLAFCFWPIPNSIPYISIPVTSACVQVDQPQHVASRIL